jgi:predicted amidohydrolase YtcJ
MWYKWDHLPAILNKSRVVFRIPLQDEQSMSSTIRAASFLCGLLLAPPVLADGPADVIYSGGVIVTVDDSKPTAQAVAVLGGKVVAVGSSQAVLKDWKGAGTQVVDLKGRTMIPGFVDAHSHFINAVEMAGWVNVSAPPVGPVKDIAGIMAALEAFRGRTKPKPGQWIIGYGYDGTTLSDGRELTRDDLDARFPDNPVVLTHVSMHGAILNSGAFRAVGIDASTPTPKGGVMLRKPGGEPSGLLMEQAYLPVYLKLPKPSEAEMLGNLKAAQEVYASQGFTTVVDAPLDGISISLYTKGADQKLFDLDLIGYARWLEFPEMVAQGTEFVSTYRNRLKWPAGVKIVGDGSPQGKTAFFTQPYLTGGPSGEQDWRGEPNVTLDQLKYLVRLAYDHNIQVEYHASGDAAIDRFLEAHEAAGGSRGRRTTILHSQFIRSDQIDKYVEYGLIPSFFTNHAFFWGDVHVKNLGEARAFFLSPMKTARARGLRPSNHTDAAVTPANALITIWTAVNRTSRSGKVIGPDERVTPLEALKAVTINAAYQYFEETSKGSIEVGKLADLAILSGNPLTVDPAKILEIQVLETIKEGKTVYRKAEGR